MQFNGAFGHKIYNATSMTLNNMSNFPTYNILSGAQHLNNGKGIHDVQISDYWLEKGDYMNFEYASLGYTFTKDMLKWKSSTTFTCRCRSKYLYSHGLQGLDSNDQLCNHQWRQSGC